MKETNFYLITDTHYFASKLGCSGEAYDYFMHYEQKCFAETECINKSVFDFLKNKKDSNTVLIAGDLSFNGELESHKELIALLTDLKNSGKKIFVALGSHDYTEKEKVFAFSKEEGKYIPEATEKSELINMYKDFGFGDALEIHERTFSYTAELSKDVRLMVLGADTDNGSLFYFGDELFSWAKAQAQKAKDEGKMMVAMCHYPILPGQPAMGLIPPMFLKNSSEVADSLADLGVHMIFTGHMHNQSINERVSKNGNKFYDICTGAIIADPAYIRFVSIKDEETAEIKSIPTPDFDFDTKGKECKQYLSDLFDNMIVNVITDLRDDPKRVMKKFEMKESKGLETLFRTVGKILCSLKVKTLSKMLFIKCDKSLENLTVKEFTTDFVRHMFEGNQPDVKGTPRGDLFLAFIERINPILKKVNVKDPDGNKADLYEILKHTAGNYGIDDYNAVLKLK